MECSTVRDLLPLYMDDLCSEETGELMEAHLKKCDSCRQVFENFNKELNWAMHKEEWKKEILPLKKVERKLRKKSGLVIMWSILFILLLGVTLLLTYGQISKSTISFEMVYEMCRMQKIGKEFAKGNVKPLYEILDSGYELQNQESSVLRLAYKSVEDYDADMINVIHEKYKKFFDGKELTYEGIESIAYIDNHIKELDRVLCVSLKFRAGDEMEYYITLYKMSNDRFLVDDYFGDPYLFFIESDTEKGVAALQEQIGIYTTEDTLFGCLSNKFYDYDLAFTRHMVMLAGQRCLENDFSLDGKEMLRVLLYSWEDLQNNTQSAGEELMKEWAKLEERGLILTDVEWNVKSYDKNVYLYQYEWELVFTNKMTGIEEVVVLDTYRLGDIFIVSEENE